MAHHRARSFDRRPVPHSRHPDRRQKQESVVPRFFSEIFKDHPIGTSIFGVVFVLLLFFVAVQPSQPNFVVKPGEGLQPKLSRIQTLWYVGDVGLPIYLGTRQHPRASKIGLVDALFADTTKYQVTVPIYPGDRIDLRWGFHFTPAPGHPLESR